MATTLTEKHDLFTRLNREDGAAIVALIDLKTEDDMDRVLNRLDVMEAKFEARFEGFEARFEGFDSRMNSMEKSFDARLDAMNHKIDTKINTLYWFVGIAVTLAVAIIRFIP